MNSLYSIPVEYSKILELQYAMNLLFVLVPSSKLPSEYFSFSSPLFVLVASPPFQAPCTLIHQPNRLPHFRHTSPKDTRSHKLTQHQLPFAVRTQCGLLFSLSHNLLCLSACFRVPPSPRSGGGSPVFFLSGCLCVRESFLLETLLEALVHCVQFFSSEAQAQPPAPVLLLCFLPLPLQLPIPLPPFSNPQPFFLPSSAPSFFFSCSSFFYLFIFFRSSAFSML